MLGAAALGRGSAPLRGEGLTARRPGDRRFVVGPGPFRWCRDRKHAHDRLHVEAIGCGAELRRCEFLVADHEHMAIGESAIERRARLRAHRPGQIEAVDLRAGVLMSDG